MSGIAEQLLFNRWRELDKTTWNKDPVDKRYKPLFAEQDQIEQELRAKYNLEIAWTMQKTYRLVETKGKPEPVKIELQKRKTAVKYDNRYRQEKHFDADGKPYWTVIDKRLLKTIDEGPYYNENTVCSLVKQLNKAERAKKARKKAVA